MTIELKPEHERTIDLAIRSGAYHDPRKYWTKRSR